jgi:hypothetical protein
MKTWKVIQNIGVYRSIELDSDYCLLCAKVHSQSQWLNKNKKKKVSVKQEEFFKIRLLMMKT